MDCFILTCLKPSRVPKGRPEWKPSIGNSGCAPLTLTRSRDNLNDVSDDGHEMSLDTLLSIFFLHLEDAGASLFLGDTGTADAGSLALSHARVDIDILDSDEKWSVFWSDEPAVDLPHQVKEDDQGTGKVELEEGIGIQVRTADWIQGDVELGHEGNNGDEDADIGAPDATRGSEGELVQGVTVVLPMNS